MLKAPFLKLLLRCFSLSLLFTLILGWIVAPVAHSASLIQAREAPSVQIIHAGEGDPASLCRLGINVSSFPDHNFYIHDFDVAPLRIGWYIDYRAMPSAPANNGAEYAMVIGVSDDEHGNIAHSPTGVELDALIAAYPGGTYIVGNEPDRRVLQGDMLPENYAYAYHDAYQEIKSKDPQAKVLAGSIVQPTPLRLQYLDRVLAAYEARYHLSLPTDGWAIHGFLLNERSCSAYNNDLNVCWGADIPPGIDAIDGDIRLPEDNARIDLFEKGIVRFRTWMASNGYRNTPLLLSEYGVLMPPVFGFSVDRVNGYMSQTFDYLLNTKDEALGYPADDNRLVQRLSWFSTFDPSFNGYLYQSSEVDDPMRPPFVLSPIGSHFRDLAAQIKETSDLAIVSVEVAGASSQVVATVANSGNRLAPTQAILRFYSGATLESAQQIGEDAVVSLPGCGTTKKVSVLWLGGAGEKPTDARIWAQISQADFPDANPDNDVASNQVIINGAPTYLPLLESANH